MNKYKSFGGSNGFEAVTIKKVTGRNGKEVAKPAFYALFVAGAIPPTQRATLEHGFKSLKALREYCAGWGIALYRLEGAQ